MHEASELDLHDAARGVAALQADVTLDLSGFASKRAVHVLSARPAHVQAALFSAFPFSAGAPASSASASRRVSANAYSSAMFLLFKYKPQ